jgi:hypothetical protein
MVSPGRASTSATRASAGAVTRRCDNFHSAIASAHHRRHSGHFRLGRLIIRAGLVDSLFRNPTGWQLRLRAREIGCRARHRRIGIGEVGLGLFNLGRLAALHQIGELPFRLLQLFRCLVTRRFVIGVVLGEQQRALFDVVAARHQDRCQ